MARKEAVLWRIPLKADWPKYLNPYLPMAAREGPGFTIPIIEDRSEELVILAVYGADKRAGYMTALNRARQIVKDHNAPIRDAYFRIVTKRQATKQQLKANHAQTINIIPGDITRHLHQFD